MLLCTPRKPSAKWSRLNKERATRLLAAGQVTEAGKAVIEAAQTSGTWSALDAVERLELPADLQKALKAHPPAKANFEAFPRSVKRAILEWIASAKREETRAARVLETATQAKQNLRANQWRQPKPRPG